MLRRLVERITARVVRNDRAKILYAEVIGPRNRHIRAFNHIFAVFIIEVAVVHEGNSYILVGDENLFSKTILATNPCAARKGSWLTFGLAQ